MSTILSPAQPPNQNPPPYGSITCPSNPPPVYSSRAALAAPDHPPAISSAFASDSSLGLSTEISRTQTRPALDPFNIPPRRFQMVMCLGFFPAVSTINILAHLIYWGTQFQNLLNLNASERAKVLERINPEKKDDVLFWASFGSVLGVKLLVAVTYFLRRYQLRRAGMRRVVNLDIELQNVSIGFLSSKR